MRAVSIALLSVAAGLLPSVAQAQCQLTTFLKLPVTMRGTRAIVPARISGQDAQFILDSGAFFSTLSRASAQAYGLQLQGLPPGFQIRGINGSTTAALATVRTLELGGVSLPKVDFIVGGTDTGQVGLLGQNFLGLRDVEYDLRHGVVRLIEAKGCKVDDLAYWPGPTAVSIIPIEPRTPQQTHTVGTVFLNGVKLRAVFDTGAPGAVLTLAAARKAGITPASPGVVASGISTGLGTRTLHTWMATFTKLQIGEETIPYPTIRISEAELNDAEMLIGADFFLSHHIYVANQSRKMLFTYEGGTVFGVGSSGARDETGKPLDLTDRSAAPTDADGFARSGAVHASSRDFAAAIADFDKAIALAPKEARFLRQRAAAHLANHQPLLGAADLDKALELDPSDTDARQMRAGLRLAARDPAGATADIRLLDQQLAASSGQRLQLASMADAAGLPELALANENAWLKAHSEDAQRPSALNGRCWARAQLNVELKAALSDCDNALRARPNTAAYLDSRALVRVRMGDLAGALTDYNAAIGLQPRNAWSLYMRGTVKRRMGDSAGGDSDRKAAIAIAPLIAERAAKFGLAN